jgi:hypothetical protein
MRTVALAGLFLLAAAVGASGTELIADAVDDSIKAMQDAAAGGDDAHCLVKLEERKDSKDARVVAAVRGLLKSSSDRIACAAMRNLSRRNDPKCLEWLKARLVDKDVDKGKIARPESFKCVLESLAGYRDPGSLKPLETVVRTFLMADGEYSTRAIRAYGSVPQKPVVDQLLDWLSSLETSHGGKTSGGAGGKSKYAPEVAKARDASRIEIYKTLVALTDQDLGDYAAWRKWWSERGKTFEFPGPAAVGADVDFAALTEWTDRRYGYTVKRPEAKGWAFLPGDKHFRIQCLKTDDSGAGSAFAGWNYYDVAGSSFKDTDDYVAWWMFKQFPDQEFEKYAPGGAPAAEERKFAGRDWTVITAKGATKGAIANWGAVEHRVYVTKFPDRFLYAWALVKTTATPEEKRQTWDFVEGVVFSAK